MIRIKANITFYAGKDKRDKPFRSGYRPLFRFMEDMHTSGQIDLINNDTFHPGDSQVVFVSFINREFLGEDFQKGKKFTISEGREILGEGTVIEVLTE